MKYKYINTLFCLPVAFLSVYIYMLYIMIYIQDKQAIIILLYFFK